MDAVMSLVEPYSTRSVRCLNLLTFDGWRLKLYGIAYRRERPVQALVDAAVTAAQEPLPRPGSPRIAMALGSSARTMAAVRTSSLWIGGRMRMSCTITRGFPARRRPAGYAHRPGRPYRLRVGPGRDRHERAAWIRHVLTRAQGPDPDLDAYLADRLSGDV